ncbi:MAG: hypothetical protein WC376_02990 [Candidatus Nanoarchaeia archaeon]|jgi:FMN phosphatase YigB (HAD superfamily)
MFKLVIVDLTVALANAEEEYSLLKKILNFKGTAQNLKLCTLDSYDKLLVGKISEKMFWNNLEKKTKTRKKIGSIKKEFFKSFNLTFDPELLIKAKSNFSFALCSNFYYPWYESIKKRKKIEFDYEAISSKVKMKKDNKKMYLSAMLNFKLLPEECLVVSKNLKDLSLAKELGMKTMLISGKHKDFSGIDYFYLKFDDFLKVLI